MKELDPQRLFYDSPYPVKLDDGAYIFRTDHDIVYAVSFKLEPFFAPIPAYWFDLTNRSGKASPSDPKVRETVIRIIVPRSHPYLDDIIERFDSEIAMFRANKPE